MKKLVLVLIVVVLLSPVGWWVWVSYRDALFADGYLLEANAAQLKATVVTPHLEEPIADGRNVLWCSTFQLAWNEACTLIGEDIHLDDEPPMVPILNKKTTTKDDLDEPSYVALAGWTQEGIVEKIRATVLEKFGEDADPELLPESLPAFWLVEYAYLFKDLRFAVPFEPLHRRQLKFRGKPVKAFGLTKTTGRANEMAKQIIILAQWETEQEHSYDFIVELKTKSEGDRLILAKLPPAQTLAQTVHEVRRHIDASRPEKAYSGTTLMVPKLNFKIFRQYKELEGKRLKVKNPRVSRMQIVRALQTVHFQLNEHGARLKSEGYMEEKSVGSRLVFDEPFLILLERRGAKTPYFALWVDNTELLVPD